MKQPTLMMKIIMSALLAGVLLYFGIYLFRSYQGGVATVRAYAQTVHVGVTAGGTLVRQESVLHHPAAQGKVADYIPAEGEKVAAGGAVATLYSSASGLDTKHQIHQLESEIEQLEYVLNSGGSPADTARLDAQVLDTVAAIRASTAAGDLSRLEADTLSLRTQVFKRDFTYGDFTAEDITQLISSKSAQLRSLRSALGSVSTTIYAPRAGVFSAAADGLESVLDPAVLDWVSPSQLRDLQARKEPLDSTAVGKLITSSTWYFAAILPAEEAKPLEEGNTYPIHFSHDWTGSADMKLERISDEEDGEVLLVFSCRAHLTDVTQLRAQTVEIVTSTLEGLSIPRQALRVIERTVTDPETGKTEQVQDLGVYVLVGAAAEFKKVELLWQDDDIFLVAPLMDSYGDRAEATRLQEGDEIIVAGAGLFDGKVVR